MSPKHSSAFFTDSRYMIFSFMQKALLHASCPSARATTARHSEHGRKEQPSRPLPGTPSRLTTRRILKTAMRIPEKNRPRSDLLNGEAFGLTPLEKPGGGGKLGKAALRGLRIREIPYSMTSRIAGESKTAPSLRGLVSRGW